MCIYELTIMYTLLQFKYVPTVKDIFMVGYRVTSIADHKRSVGLQASTTQHSILHCTENNPLKYALDNIK